MNYPLTTSVETSCFTPHPALRPSWRWTRLSGPVLDLCAPPWIVRRSAWSHPDDYGACQRLAQACRERGDVSWIRYASARRVKGICAAVLEPACLRMKSPRSQQTWSCKVTRSTVPMAHDDDRLSMHFAQGPDEL
jgi:hypothetical protein